MYYKYATPNGVGHRAGAARLHICHSYGVHTINGRGLRATNMPLLTELAGVPGQLGCKYCHSYGVHTINRRDRVLQICHS